VAFGDEHLVTETPKKPERKPEPPKPETAMVGAVVVSTPPAAGDADYGDLDFDDEDDDFSPTSKEGKKKKAKERQQRREIVFDEDRGVQVVKRKRKGNRGRGGW